MPNQKVANLSGGIYRSDTPEQIPEISWSDLSNWDPVNESLQSRDGYQTTSTTPVHAGCLQFGYQSPSIQGNNHITVKEGDFGPSSSGDSVKQASDDDEWCMFFYCKPFDPTPTSQTIIDMRDTTDAFSSIKLDWTTGSSLRATVQPASGDTPVSLISSTTPSGTAHLYGVRISFRTPSWPYFTLRIYDHTGITGTTIVNTVHEGAFDNITKIIVGADHEGYNGCNGYFSDLIITKNETPSTTITTSYNVVPSGHTCATANRIAYYKFHKDLTDSWEVNPDFIDPPEFATGAGLVTYQVKDTVMTSPQVESEIHSTKSVHVDTYDQDRHWYFYTDGTVSTTYSAYLNPSGQGYTISMAFLPIQMSKTSTSFVIFDCGSYGPKISMQYASKDKVRMVFKHTVDSSESYQVSTTIPMGTVANLMFDYNYTASTISRCKIFNNFQEIAVSTTSGIVQPVTTTITEMNFFYNPVGTTHNTSGKDVEFYMSGFMAHKHGETGDAWAGSVATTWSKKPPADIKKINQYETKKRYKDVEKRVDDRYSALREAFGLEPKTEWKTVTIEEKVFAGQKIEAGEQRAYNRHIVPSFDKVFLMYFFNEVSEHENAGSTDRHGRIINIKDADNSHNSSMEGYFLHAPSWVIDRNDAGLVNSTMGNDDYMDEFDSAFSYVPARVNLGDKILLAQNNNLIDPATGTTYVFDGTYKWHRKKAEMTRGFMYGNDLYIHNTGGMFRFDGRNTYPTDIPAPSIPITASAVTGGSGINGAYMYTYTYTNKNGAESVPAPITSLTIPVGRIDLSFTFNDSESNILRNMVESINVYRNKGSVGTASTLVDNNGTSLYLLKTIPYTTVMSKGSGTVLIQDKVADSSLGRALPVTESIAIPYCKYSTVWSESGIYTGEPAAPNHYYVSAPEQPDIMDYAGEFRTEDGQENTGVAKMSSGFMIFKDSSRKFVLNGDETKAEEYDNGGCVSHDSIVSIGNEVIGLGLNGFFSTNGYRYEDITTEEINGRKVSSVQKDVDSWSISTKRNAKAVYHSGTDRYICYVDGKLYVYFRKRRVWTKYQDFVGIPLIYKNDLYIFRKGWLWKEYTSQAYLGTSSYEANITSGTVGEVVVTSTTALPTTQESGLMAYVGNTQTWVKGITSSGTTYTVKLRSNTNFSSESKLYINRIDAYADTKNFEDRTPSKNKASTLFMLEHDSVTGGQIDIQFARDSSDIDDSYVHFEGQTDRGRIITWTRCMGRNIKYRLSTRDGNQHTLKSYTREYEQLDYGY